MPKFCEYFDKIQKLFIIKRMDSICKDCYICCKIIPVSKDGNMLLRDGLQSVDEDFLQAVYELSEDEALIIDADYVQKVGEIFPDAKFYGCKNFNSENGCSLEEKPNFCKIFPKSPLAIVPDACAYLGEVFINNEELKRKIRMIKEEILDYQNLIESGDKDASSYKKIIENLNRFIMKYKDFGSENW